MTLRRCFAIALLCAAAASTAVAQNLNPSEFSPSAPAEWATAPPSAAAAPEGAAAGGAPANRSYGGGVPQFGYQFCYGSLVIYPGGPPWAYGIMALTRENFPYPPAQKLYSEWLQWVGFNPSGPYQGALFRCTINGNTLYVLFGTTNMGSENGVPLRRLRYFDGYGRQIYSTCARFYTP